MPSANDYDEQKKYMLSFLADSSSISRRSDYPGERNVKLMKQKYVRDCFLPAIMPVSELQTKNDARVSTGCPRMDSILNGGWVRGHIAEVSGEAGAGKTQIILQTLLTCASQGNTAVLLLSEDMPSSRLSELAAAVAEAAQPRITTEQLLERFLVHKVVGDEMMRKILLTDLPQLIQSRKKTLHPVACIAVDSIAAVVGVESAPTSAAQLGYLLMNLCTEHGIAVVVANQVRASFRDSSALLGGNHSRSLSNIVPALGMLWATLITSRLLLHKVTDSRLRSFSVVFSPYLPPSIHYFEITSSGIFVVDTD